MQTVKDADNALFERGAPHYAVVNDDEVIHVWLQTSICYVVNVGRQIIAAIAFGYEGAEFYVFYCHLLTSYAP